jgi:hypothetical protein
VVVVLAELLRPKVLTVLVLFLDPLLLLEAEAEAALFLTSTVTVADQVEAAALITE